MHFCEVSQSGIVNSDIHSEKSYARHILFVCTLVNIYVEIVEVVGLGI